MKNKGFFKMPWVFTLALICAACSAEVSTEPVGDPTPLVSPKTQSLVLTGKGESQLQVNEVYMEAPPTTVTYFFDYAPKKSLLVEWELYSSISRSCFSGDVLVQARWLEMEDSKKVAEYNWSLFDKFVLEANKQYKLSLTFNNLASCSDMLLEFIVWGEEVKDVALGSEDLLLGYDYRLSPSRRDLRMYYDYDYRSTFEQELYFSYLTTDEDYYCRDEYHRDMEWLELNDKGEVVKALPITELSSFRAEKNKNYKLRIWFKNASECSRVLVSFSVKN